MSRRSLRWSTVLGAVLGIVATVFVVRTLVAEWPRVSEVISDARWAWLVVALVLAAAGMVFVAWAWRSVLELLGADVPTGRVIAWYFVGELGKYLPGGVWPVLGRGELARRSGVPRPRAYASVALSLGLLYLSACFVAAAFLPFALASDGFDPWMLCLLVLPVGVIGLHHRVLERLVGLAQRATRRELALEVPRWGRSLALVARYIPAWLCIGTATWAVARSLTPDASFPRIMFAAVLSWVAGFLVVPVPAGAGVREAVLLAASGLPPGVAAAVAVVSRVVFIVVDAAGGALGAPLAGRREPLPVAASKMTVEAPERREGTDGVGLG